MARKAKSLTKIEDPRLEPYFITKDDNCYTVNERVIPNQDHFRSKGNIKEGNYDYYRPIYQENIGVTIIVSNKESSLLKLLRILN